MAKKHAPINLVEGLKDGLNGAGTKHPVEGMASYREGDLVRIPIGELSPNPDQPRQHFDEQALRDLTDSIREKGVLQPIVALFQQGTPGFTIVAGERRWRASKAAGLKTIPAIIRTSADSAEIALIENVQRDNLTPLEEAEALANLKEQKGYTDAALAKIIGKSRPTVVQTLSLLKIPDDVREELAGQQFSKTVILQAFSQGGPEKVRAVLAGDQPITRAALRKEKKAQITKGGRPKNHVHSSKHDDLGATISIRFTRTKASDDDVKAVLAAELDRLGGIGKAARGSA